jgi:hypothetical protein
MLLPERCKYWSARAIGQHAQQTSCRKPCATPMALAWDEIYSLLCGVTQRQLKKALQLGYKCRFLLLLIRKIYEIN